jgi:hypothetical protein
VLPPNQPRTDTALTLSVYIPHWLSGLRSDRCDSSLWVGEKFSHNLEGIREVSFWDDGSYMLVSVFIFLTVMVIRWSLLS